MKRLSLSLAIIFMFVWAFPVRSFAISKDQFIIRCQSTVPDETSGLGGVLYGTVFKDISNQYGADVRPNIISALSEFDFSLLNDYPYYLVSFQSSNTTSFTSGTVVVHFFNSDLQPYYVSLNGYNSVSSSYIYGSLNFNIHSYSCFVSTSGHNDWTLVDGGIFQSVYLNGADDNGYGQSSFSYSCVLDTNIPVLAEFELAQLDDDSTTTSWGSTILKAWAFGGGFAEATDIFANTEGYDAQGNVVSGGGSSGEESSANHLYFKSCDIGFCYPTFSSNAVNFGGAYFYIRYTVDDWIVEHINDYELVFYADAEIGDNLINTQRIEVPLDPDGCIVLPFNEVWADDLIQYGYNVLVSSDVIEKNFVKANLYSLASNQFNNFGEKVTKYEGTASLPDAISALLDGDIAHFLFNLTNTDVTVYTKQSVNIPALAQKFNPYLISAFCALSADGDTSGLYSVKFNLVTGTTTVDDTTGLTNPDPYVPDDTSEDDYLPPVPSDGENSTTPTTIIYTGGTWSGKMNATIGFDPGYTDLKNDLNANPEGNFTNYLAPFKDENTAEFIGDAYSSFPVELKTILVSGFGILTLLGIYRFIRRG